MIKKFKDFILENYLEEPSDPKVVKDKKKLLKNGYMEVVVDIPVEGVEKGDKVLVSATEFGQLTDDTMVTSLKDDKEILIPKGNLRVETKSK